jgi:hypothetical protein
MRKIQGPYIIGCFLSVILRASIAQYQSFNPPGQNDIVFTVNVPQKTASSGLGPIFIQMNSTVDVEWFALGQGTHMQGSNIIVVYGSGDNITVSPRLGGEHVEPLYNSQAQVLVLAGSGISNGSITANIRCDSCITWPGGHEDVTNSSSSWIWAVKYGQLLESASVSATITMHDIYGLASFNLPEATGGNSKNPFLTPFNPSNSSTAPIVTTFSTQSINRRRIAHATIMIAVMAVLFPLFAMGLHVVPPSKAVLVHAWMQLFTLALATAGFGIGISLAINLRITGSYHVIIGIIVVSSLILFQPAMGLLQHRYFHKTGEKGLFAYLHRWFGRSIITLGIINAGLGFRLTGIGTSIAPVGAVVGYSVVAGTVWIGYVSVISFLTYRRRHRCFS